MQRQRCEMVWGGWVEGVNIDLRVHMFDSRGQIPRLGEPGETGLC